MNKSILISRILYHIEAVQSNSTTPSQKKHLSVDKLQIKGVLEAFFETVRSSVSEGEVVSLRDFGTFKLDYKQVKIIQHSQTPFRELVPLGHFPVFTPCKDFKQEVFLRQKVKSELDNESESDLPF